ncbi:MAG: prepilin-type N-terminal cleavage/methylation domain-containing protein [Phycisphaerales bacterium]|nr:prepilin-type N-terminal cleavage/methylation domain-containing protein [Phycisphaerales bacterium]
MPLLSDQRRSHHRFAPAFSLVELVIVVVIIGIIGAIAVPRISSSSENAAAKAVVADTRALQHAVDLYTTEHEGVLPHVGAGTAKVFYFRLIKKSDLDGTINASGIYGPYIDGIPVNRHNGLQTIRHAGAAAGANTHGWRYDTTSGLIEPDHTTGTKTFKVDTGTVKEATEKLINDLGG